MIASTNFLALCHELKRAGWRPPLEPGMRVSRGYADVGYEEFLLLPNGKLLSLISGTQSDFPEKHRDHFCLVPGVGDLVAEVRRQGFDLDPIVFAEQRTFRLRAAGSGRTAAAESASLDDALAKLLLVILGGGAAVC